MRSKKAKGVNTCNRYGSIENLTVYTVENTVGTATQHRTAILQNYLVWTNPPWSRPLWSGLDHSAVVQTTGWSRPRSGGADRRVVQTALGWEYQRVVQTKIGVV